MKLTIKHDPGIAEPEITVCYGYLDSELEEILAFLSLADNRMAGRLNGETYFISVSDIFYFETVDRKCFFYTAHDSYETKMKLGEIEAKLAHTPFSRISKSTLVNLKKVRSINSEKHSRLCATLLNGEKVIVSRQYLNSIKEKLGV
ncbi:MAG: LytTR family transcriptional regulator DNA-binding domain-containing protein [Clostridia bacterium]|nr:LytTR family transcriptional regulator DNA-binding domain-containing protein [Clostridia bacterium]